MADESRFRPAQPVLRPKPEAVAELGQLRHRELQTLCDRLERVERPSPARWWNGAAVVLTSTALGSLVTGIPLLNSKADWDSWVTPVYGVAVLLCFVLAGVCALAARNIGTQRADSVAGVKSDLDALLSAYEAPAPAVDDFLSSDTVRPLLQRIRAEARDNLEALQRAANSGQYWGRLEGVSLKTKEWKDNRALFEGSPAFEDIYEKGRHACAEVERVDSALATRLFSRNRRQIREDDRLNDAVEALTAFDAALTTAMRPDDQ